MHSPLIAVILSGGVGARLWPVSREALPKPFIKLHEGDSLLQRTVARVLALPDAPVVLTVTNRDYYFLTRDEYAAVPGTAGRFEYLLEPVGRNTAAAIGAAAMLVEERFGARATMLVLPADHVIENQSAFAAAVQASTTLAADGWLVTFGVEPSRAESGYGYIERGEPVSGVGDAYAVSSFVEKPNVDRATELVESGRYLWNSGMFCFAAGAINGALSRYCPDVAAAVKTAVAASDRSRSPVYLDPAAFAAIPDISIDYAVMERSDRVAVVAADFGWEDVGSWRALAGLMPADAEGNRVNGEAVMIDSRNCYVQADAKIIAAVGVDNLIVVDTPDALLVSQRDRAQDVKLVVDRLRLQSHATARHHRTVHRPWGSYTILEEGPGFKIKRIVVRPGASLSLQRHRHRSEHWVVVSGEAAIVNAERQIRIAQNESAFIPAGTVHRLSNPGEEDCVMIEVQVGGYVGEDDIERLDDVYGRSVQEKT